MMPPICFVPSPCPVNRVKSQSQKQPTAALDSQGYDGSGEKSLPPNRFGRYRLCKALQIGSTSEVYLAEDIYTEEKVALKKLKLDDPEHNFKVAEHEANSHQRINGHSHIVSLKGMAVLSRTQVAIATEFVPGGDLFDLCKLNGLPSEQFNRFALQITSALVHMHNLGYAHCDLKPENVLITNSNGLKCAKLSDFGSARHYQAVVCFRTQGTDGFQSPEEVAKKRLRDLRPSDVWSLAILFFNMATGSMPWANADVKDSDFASHKQGKVSRRTKRQWARIPDDWRALMSQMLAVNRKHRPCIDIVYSQMKEIVEKREQRPKPTILPSGGH